MNSIQKALGLVLLAFLVFSFLPLGATTNALWQSATSGTASASAAGSTLERATPASVNHIVPLSILVYTQYVDDAPGGELENTLAAINETYSTDYYYTNLTNYVNLATALPGHQILLIPEQENANSTITKAIGTAWASTLTQFVTGGGIVILMDYISLSSLEVAPTVHIYNASGLLKAYGPASHAAFPVNLVNTSDALARGIAAGWVNPDGTLTFSSAEGTVVVDDGTYPVVTHKIVGKGHVVLLGYDLFNREPNADEILANAIRLHRHVVFDASHAPFGNIFGALSSFADDLVGEGFAVSSMGSFSAGLIQACDVLVLIAGSTAYSPAEANVIRDFVLGGGGLFVAPDWGPFGDELDPVTTGFGFVRNATAYMLDSDDSPGPASYIVYDNSGSNQNIVNHSVTLAVDRLELDRPGGLITVPAGAVTLVSTDTDGTSTWSGGGPANGIALAAALVTGGSGRVFVVADWDFMSDSNDPDADGVQTYFDSDNDFFLVNSIRWLSAAGVKERIVLFEESHGASWLATISYLGFAKYLTSNGYTVYWMETFYASLVNRSHVLVICDGAANYTASELQAIKAFVAAGGGLLIIGGYGASGTQVDPICNQFGLDLHDTYYLRDSDDNEGSINNVVYSGTNIRTHPIMTGIQRIEVYTGTGLVSIGTGAALITTDTDGTTTWSNGDPANGISVFAATEYGLGHVVVVTEKQFFRYNADADADGEPNFFDSDNNLFAVNVIAWLSEPQVPVVTPVFPWWLLPLIVVIIVVIIVVVVLALVLRKRGAAKK